MLINCSYEQSVFLEKQILCPLYITYCSQESTAAVTTSVRLSYCESKANRTACLRQNGGISIKARHSAYAAFQVEVIAIE
ncbi:hypothetical protein N7510_003425 [Penicillium lagena]|uniref:uncharacterized protein n=1 Tax=Penicillium lagena TaxID=94218 RepID=UPI0025418838|nr:uncharacterized protein N7510_003425 [Penicillium lagena]KAJ5619441.1 hypothetical protein N7510_003425 [Penicillium lagena]